MRYYRLQPAEVIEFLQHTLENKARNSIDFNILLLLNLTKQLALAKIQLKILHREKNMSVHFSLHSKNSNAHASNSNESTIFPTSPEIIIQIFRHLNCPELGQAALVSKDWEQLSEDNILWKGLVEKTFKFYNIPAGKLPWKQWYKILKEFFLQIQEHIDTIQDPSSKALSHLEFMKLSWEFI